MESSRGRRSRSSVRRASIVGKGGTFGGFDPDWFHHALPGKVRGRVKFQGGDALAESPFHAPGRSLPQKSVDDAFPAMEKEQANSGSLGGAVFFSQIGKKSVDSAFAVV